MTLLWLFLAFHVAGGFRAPVQQGVYQLTSGLEMQTLSSTPANVEGPRVVFVHGSNHGAWCWAEHWFGFFAERQHASVALNLRGTSGAYPPQGYNGGKKKVPLADHMADLASAVTLSTQEAGEDGIVLVGHSFGAFLLMKFMETPTARSLVQAGAIKGLGLLCSVPPVGSSPQVRRMLLSKPVLAFQVTWGLAAKKVLESVSLCRRCFMDDAMPDELVEKYMEQLRKDSDYGLDLKEINANLPIQTASDDNGVASWIASETNRDGLPSDAILVLGASEDVLVDPVGVQATADFCAVKPVLLDGVHHDVMLDTGMWEVAAGVVAEWAQRIKLRQTSRQ
eukprot:scaffold57_cov254-Pinguiococcus_pyrenoidosus.AAC.12